jgi:hypothetical protein
MGDSLEGSFPVRIKKISGFSRRGSEEELAEEEEDLAGVEVDLEPEIIEIYKSSFYNYYNLFF